MCQKTGYSFYRCNKNKFEEVNMSEKLGENWKMNNSIKKLSKKWQNKKE